MKTFPLVIGAWLLGGAMALAQEPPKSPVTRADIHVVLGWQNLRNAQPVDQRYGYGYSYDNDWINGIFFGGAGAGWYWTDNLKTQVDVGAGTKGRQYRYQPVITGGQQTGSLSSLVSVQQQNVAIAQHYQFFRNQWFHPHVGAGVNIARETTRTRYDPIYFFDPVTRVSRQIAAPGNEGPDHRVIARPFGEAGFKAYMTRRAFFTGDTRWMFKDGLDEVLFRFGFGVDF